MRLRVGVTYNLRKDFAHSENQPVDSLEEFDAEETIDAMKAVLEGEGHEVIKLGGGPGLIDRLKQTALDIVLTSQKASKGEIARPISQPSSSL